MALYSRVHRDKCEGCGTVQSCGQLSTWRRTLFTPYSELLSIIKMDSAGFYETMVKSQPTRRHISEKILRIKPLFALCFQFRVCVPFLISGTLLSTLFSNTAPKFFHLSQDKCHVLETEYTFLYNIGGNT